METPTCSVGDEGFEDDIFLRYSSDFRMLGIHFSWTTDLPRSSTRVSACIGHQGNISDRDVCICQLFVGFFVFFRVFLVLNGCVWGKSICSCQCIEEPEPGPVFFVNFHKRNPRRRLAMDYNSLEKPGMFAIQPIKNPPIGTPLLDKGIFWGCSQPCGMTDLALRTAFHQKAMVFHGLSDVDPCLSSQLAQEKMPITSGRYHRVSSIPQPKKARCSSKSSAPVGPRL